MSQEVTTAFIRAYNQGVRLLQQQIPSRLMNAVQVDMSVTGDRAFYDQVDAVEMTEITNRHGDTEYTETPHRRRMVTPKSFEVADLVDRADRRRLLNDPVNPYSRSMAAAANRRIDRTVLEAFDGTASTGVDGTGSAAFDTDFSFNATGTSQALIVADIVTARSLLEAEENMEDEGDHRWYAYLSAVARQQLLGDTTLTSQDFNTVRALVNGQIDQYVGFSFLKGQLAPIDAGGIRDTFFWVKASMQLAVWEEPRSFIDVLPQKRHSIQVRYEQDLGATRMDEKGVVRVLVDEVP